MTGKFALRALGKGSVASFIGGGLQIAWWLLWAGAIAVALSAVVYAVLLVLIANGMADPKILTGGTSPLNVGGAHGELTIDWDNANGITWPVAVPGLLAAGIGVGGALVIVTRLRRMFASFTSGEPFRRENADHLRVIWITMLIVEVSRYAMHALTVALLKLFAPAVEQAASVSFRVDLTTWSSILILIVLAEVFREGARMREEQDLTI